jgi:hypothetical protein
LKDLASKALEAATFIPGVGQIIDMAKAGVEIALEIKRQVKEKLKLKREKKQTIAESEKTNRKFVKMEDEIERLQEQVDKFDDEVEGAADEQSLGEAVARRSKAEVELNKAKDELDKLEQAEEKRATGFSFKSINNERGGEEEADENDWGSYISTVLVGRNSDGQKYEQVELSLEDLLVKNAIRTSAEASRMSKDSIRNTIIVELSKKTFKNIAILQSLSNDELLKFWNKFVPDKIKRCSTFAAAKCKTTSGAIEITESFIAGINLLQTSGSSLTAVGSALWWDDVVKDPTRIIFEPIAAKGVCSNDINIAKAKCSSNPECEAIAKQSNGCWWFLLKKSKTKLVPRGRRSLLASREQRGHLATTYNYKRPHQPFATCSTNVQFGDRFVQIGEWRFADIDGRHFSMAHKSGKTAQIYRSDGTLHPGPRNDFHSRARSRDNSAPGISFGDRFIQIGKWRICDFDGVHASICTTSGKTAQIYKSDGTVHPGPRNDYCCNARAIDPTDVRAPQIGDRYIQIGEWRFGDIDGRHASVSHGKKTAQIFREDGTLHPDVNNAYHCQKFKKCGEQEPECSMASTEVVREAVVNNPSSFKYITNWNENAPKVKLEYLGEGGCHDDINKVTNKCNENRKCVACGQQKNGCWHMFKASTTGKNQFDANGYKNWIWAPGPVWETTFIKCENGNTVVTKTGEPFDLTRCIDSSTKDTIKPWCKAKPAYYIASKKPVAVPTVRLLNSRRNSKYEKNIVREKAPRVGGWGGECTCPDGQKYYVGDNSDSCRSLACVGGKSGTCNRKGGKWSYRKVTCGGHLNMPNAM